MSTRLTAKECEKLVDLLMLNGREIYDTIIAIEAKKGKRSLWPKQKFRHDFKDASRAKVIGLPDGSLLIVSMNHTNLWKTFKY